MSLSLKHLTSARAMLAAGMATLLLIVTVGAAAGAGSGKPVKKGHYTGAVGPGWPISFSVSSDGEKVEHLVAGFDAGCNGPAGDTPTMFHFGALAIHNGSFSGKALDDFGKKVSETLRITGSFSARTAKGHVSDTSHITSLPNCTESSSFTATAH
ncbi:MAG TPA: hypothetical protein VFR48_11470 [Solirubrobacteraceae bacterium]|nr:hypothetical protein [Solirubrobacteraceae bacterium]